MRCISPLSMRSHSLRRDDARNDVERENALAAAVVPVQRERDAHAQQGALGRRLTGSEHARRKAVDVLDQRLGARPRARRPCEHLVENGPFSGS